MKPLNAKLNLETARIPWHELARYFAAGKVIRVSPGLDLVEVAAAVAEDEASRVDGWMAQGLVAPVSDREAEAWHESGAEVWALVVKPFVLVQKPADD